MFLVKTTKTPVENSIAHISSLLYRALEDLAERRRVRVAAEVRIRAQDAMAPPPCGVMKAASNMPDAVPAANGSAIPTESLTAVISL